MEMAQDVTQEKARHMMASINIIRKQMVLQEVYQDIIRIQSIIQGLLKYDSALSLTPEQLKRRQELRKEFSDFIIYEIKHKYSNQLYLFIEAGQFDPQLDAQMKRKPEDYALEARGILLKICTLMMHHKIQLSREPDQDWIEILADHDDIASLINRLSNLVVDQMTERENAVTFPLEDMEQLLEIGARVWEEQIDPKALQIVPRAHLDQFLLDNGVVKDYKEILLFTSGVLSGREIPRNSDIKKSQFMKIVYKCVMRKSVLNIIKFTNIGGASGGSVAFSTGI
jgi:hypothetical protein